MTWQWIASLVCIQFWVWNISSGNLGMQMEVTMWPGTSQKFVSKVTGVLWDITQSRRKKAHVEDAEDTEEISEPLSALIVSSSAAASKVKMFLQYISHIDKQQFHRSPTQETQYIYFMRASTLILRDMQDSQVISTTSAIMAITRF